MRDWGGCWWGEEEGIGKVLDNELEEGRGKLRALWEAEFGEVRLTNTTKGNIS